MVIKLSGIRASYIKDYHHTSALYGLTASKLLTRNSFPKDQRLIVCWHGNLGLTIYLFDSAPPKVMETFQKEFNCRPWKWFPWSLFFWELQHQSQNAIYHSKYRLIVGNCSWLCQLRVLAFMLHTDDVCIFQVVQNIYVYYRIRKPRNRMEGHGTYHKQLENTYIISVQHES